MATNRDAMKWWVLGALGVSLGLFLLDETVVGVALPTIRKELGLSLVQGHWVVNIYLLTLSGLVAACGKLCDIFGHKRLFIGGVGLFGAASVACGFATEATWLLIARAVQGAGAACLFPSSRAMIALLFPEEERGRAIGIYGAIGTVFMTAGPLVGGFFAEVVSWRWIFWLNPPLVLAAAAVVGLYWSDPPREAARPRFDLPGLVLLVVGLSLAVFAAMESPDLGWSNPLVWGLLPGGLVLLNAFVLLELRRKTPLIEVDLLGRPAFAACNLMIFTAQFTKITGIIIGALYLQREFGMGPLAAGTLILVAILPQIRVAPWCGRMTDRLGSRTPALIGLTVTLAAFLWLAAAVAWRDVWLIAPALVAWGSVNSLLFIPALRGGANSVPREKQGQVSGIMLTSQLLGGTVGMALCYSLLATFDSFRWPFLATAGVVLASLAMSAWAMPRERPSE